MDSYLDEVSRLLENESINPISLVQICGERLRLDIKYDVSNLSSTYPEYFFKVI